MRHLITTKYIDFFVIQNISIAVSVSYLVILFNLKLISPDNFWILFGQHVFFVLGVLYGSLLFYLLPKKKDSEVYGIDKISFLKSQLSRRDTRQIYWLFFCFVVAYKIIYSYVLITQFGSGDARLVLSKAIRGFDIFFGGLDNIVMLMVVLYFSINKSKLNILALVLFAVVSFFTGSKGSIISIVLALIVFESLLNRVKIVSLKNIALFCFGVISIIAIRSFWMGRLDIMGFIDRIIGSGDVYHISLITGNYEKLMGYYNPLAYILHPFTAIFGYRGYEYPLGSMLMTTMGYVAGPNGPNPQLPVLNAVLFGKAPVFLCIYIFIIGLLMAFMMKYGYKMLFDRKSDIFLKIILFKLFYLSALDIYLDQGYFIIGIVKSIVALFVVIALKMVMMIFDRFAGKAKVESKYPSAN
jgi:hypothetical protein